MNKVISIMTLLLVLILKQDYPLHPVEVNSANHAIFKEANFILSTPGPGCIEDRDYRDSNVIISEYQLYRKKDESLACAGELEHFGFSVAIHPNPLLIDRPPPAKSS